MFPRAKKKDCGSLFLDFFCKCSPAKLLMGFGGLLFLYSQSSLTVTNNASNNLPQNAVVNPNAVDLNLASPVSPFPELFPEPAVQEPAVQDEEDAAEEVSVEVNPHEEYQFLASSPSLNRSSAYTLHRLVKEAMQEAKHKAEAKPTAPPQSSQESQKSPQLCILLKNDQPSGLKVAGYEGNVVGCTRDRRFDVCRPTLNGAMSNYAIQLWERDKQSRVMKGNVYTCTRDPRL